MPTFTVMPSIDQYRAWADEDERFYQDLEARRQALPADLRPFESQLLLDARAHVKGRFYEGPEVTEEAVSALNDFERGLSWLSENVTEAEEVHYGRSVQPYVEEPEPPGGESTRGRLPGAPGASSVSDRARRDKNLWWVVILVGIGVAVFSE